jgi:glycosyltransferase involved in cell wall biosynthesis
LKYSFIIPVLNEEKIILNLLRQIRESGLHKKYDYEIILSDGGSSDNTVVIALPFVDKTVVHSSATPQNISVGRNKGADISEGVYLVFINGDVLFEDIDRFFSVLENDFIGSHFSAFTCCVKIHPYEETISDCLFLGFYNIFFHFLNVIGIGMGRGECHVLRKDLFKSLNGNNPVLVAGEDFELFTRIRRKGKILYSHKTCIYESPRRYRKEGHFRILFSWFINSISVLIWGRSVSRKWEPVR